MKTELIKLQDVIFIACLAILITGIAFFGTNKKQQFVQDNQSVDPVAKQHQHDLESVLEFSKYTPREAVASKSKEGYMDYRFTQGQPDFSNNHNNYTITFPQTWAAYTYTNSKDGDAHGTNLLLKKSNNFIVISQQLYESGTCVLDDSIEPWGMSYKCNLIESVHEPNKPWNIYTVDKLDERPWVEFNVCDENMYSQALSTYTTPTEYDKSLCSPWTSVGEIKLFVSPSDQDAYVEYVEIVKSIKVIK